MEYKCKVSIIGNDRVGKTSIILRYFEDTFSEEYITTLGADFVDKPYTKEKLPLLGKNDIFNLVIWDMAGQAHFKDIATIYCEGSAGLIIVFDVNNKKTFDALPEWEKFRDDVTPKAKTIIIGNKTDLPMAITQDEIKKMEEKLQIPIRLASAKKKLSHEESNIDNIFTEMAQELLNLYLKKKK